ncbi:MAG: hypothetical protein WA029_09295 [Anaerolineae bacterium]
MTMQNITLQLPETTMRRAQRVANVLQHPLQQVLADMLAAALPDVDDAPVMLQAELARMTWVSNQDLWTIARSALSHQQQMQMQILVEFQSQRPLTPEEQAALESLREEYGRVTLRKARAYALLSLRGVSPLLSKD